MNINDIEVTYTQELGLSEREFQVNKEIAFGFILKEIADKLCLSIETIKTYSKRIKAKIGARNSADMTRIFMKANQQMFFAYFFLFLQFGIIYNDANFDMRKTKTGRKIVKVKTARKK